MFPSVCPKALLLALMCVCAAAAAARNGSAKKTKMTFPVRYETVTDKPFDQSDSIKPNCSTAGGRSNTTKSRRQIISDDVLLFLTGPVSTVLIPSFYSLVLISVPINFCALLAFARGIRPKNPAVIYMMNLACADLIFGILLPFKISYHFGGNDWIFGPFMCRVVTAAFYWNMYCSVLLIACISVDRLLGVVYPIDSLPWRTPRNSIIACVTMWILSFAGSVPLVLSEQTHHITALNITTCHDVQVIDDLIWKYRIYFVTLCCALFFLPLLVTVVSYARVIWCLSRVPAGVPGRCRRRTRAAVMSVTVLVMFVLCFAPTNCLLLAHYLQFNEGMKENQQQDANSSYSAYLVFLCLGSLNCLLDPLVYYFGSSQCQKQLSSFLRCENIRAGKSISHSTTDSCRYSSRAILKSSCTESSRINTSDSLTVVEDDKY
uniref:Proteinase-activated receptor 1 n=1 Tax=Sparus aurata TaxID=8175 RepID=A0A671UDJ5_SPAAU